MDSFNTWDVHLGREEVKSRSFLLGNKRAFSLSLPASTGPSDTLLHSHKWFGAYLYGRKFVEGQVLRATGHTSHFLGAAQQTNFTMSLTSARREYQVEGRQCSEEFFVPDAIQGFACTIAGDLDFAIDPEFDMRFYRALNSEIDSYEVELVDNGMVVSNILPSGAYDDATETFTPMNTSEDATRLYAAVTVLGDNVTVDLLKGRDRPRRKLFQQDSRRRRFVEHMAPAEAANDHAPLWNRSESLVYAPARIYFHGQATLVYGFGASREEAFAQADALRENLIGYQAQKTGTATEIMSRAGFETGSQRIDRAYAQVLTRFMDALVARNAVAEDTPLVGPATMILAGNQYFHDSWKRDENIAVGVLLSLGFYELARDVIQDTWQLQDQRTGRLPQRIRAGEEPPYHSSDGTLWALWRLYQYWRCTGDESLLYDKLPMVRLFFQRSIERAVDGMLPSGRTHTPEYLWETWMDTPHTPRDGFPIEIQMLWIASLRCFRPIVHANDSDLERLMGKAEDSAWRALERFNVRGVPADSLDESGEVRDLITPNAYFSFGVGLDLGPAVEGAMRDIGRRQLAGRQGIITLAPEDWARVFTVEFLSDRRNVRGRRMQSIGKFNYHRGVEWNWLSQFFVLAELKYGNPDVAFRKYLRAQVAAALDRGGIGGISELHDLSGARGPDFQAWSMAGFLEALHAFAGVRVDVPARRISIEPQIPQEWPKLQLRKWYGAVPFDLTYGVDGRTHTLIVDFPWGDAPDVDLDLSLVLPRRRVAESLDVRLDGCPQSPVFTTEPIAGGESVRVRFSVSAHQRIEITLATKRAARTVALTA